MRAYYIKKNGELIAVEWDSCWDKNVRLTLSKTAYTMTVKGANEFIQNSGGLSLNGIVPNEDADHLASEQRATGRYSNLRWLYTLIKKNQN